MLVRLAPSSSPTPAVTPHNTTNTSTLIDLTTLFTWNTKQIFLYITASYPPPPSSTHSEKNPPPPHSTAIIWDAILPHSHSPAHENHYIYPNPKKSAKSAKGKGKVEEKGKQHPGILKLAGQRPKYQITDPSGRVASRANATLELHYNIQPWVGALTWGSPRAATPGAGAGARQQGASQQGEGLFGILSLQRYFPALGAKTPSFNFPALKDRSDAAKSAGSDGLGVASGKEKNRGSPA